MKVGDYIRTKKGEIGKIIGYVDDPTDYYFNCYETDLKTTFTDKFITEYDDIKSSPNIIDLIEVGDYVNGKRVNFVYSPDGKQVFRIEFDVDGLKGHMICESKHIKSVAAKEQFEAIKYEIK